MKKTGYTAIALLMLALLSGNAALAQEQQLLKDVRELSSDKYQGRQTGTPGNQLAADYIIGRFKTLGLASYNGTYRQKFPVKVQEKKVTGTNLIGYIAGKKTEAIVISAHYDHLGVFNNEVFNGADDNASGVAGILSIASYFSRHQPEHTLIFAAFDAEETGCKGAKAFVDHPPLPLTQIIVNINLDMISHNDKGELYVAGTYYYPQLKKYLVTSTPHLKLLTGHDNPTLPLSDNWTNQSDHYAFHQKKIPFLYFGVEDHKDYHRPTDDFENINQSFLKEAVNAIQEVVINIDRGLTLQKKFKRKQIMK